MKAIRYDAYGPPEVLELRDVEVPAVHDDEVLVWVRAASVNPLGCVRAGSPEWADFIPALLWPGY